MPLVDSLIRDADEGCYKMAAYLEMMYFADMMSWSSLQV